MSESSTHRLSLRDLVAHARLAVARTRQASPSLLSALIGLEVIAAVTPAIFALGIGLVVRQAQALYQAEAAPGQERALLLALIALGVISLLSALVSVARQYVLARLVDTLRLHVSTDVFGHLARLDLDFFEDPASQDTVERASRQPGRDLAYFLVNTISIGTHGFQALSLAALLLFVEPVFTLVVFIAALPWLRFRWRMAELTYETEREQTQTRRWSAYYARTLTGRAFVPTVRTYRLAPVLLRRYAGYLERIIEVNRRLYRRQALGSATASTIVSVAGLGLVIWVGIRAFRGDVSFAVLGTFVVAASRIEASIRALVDSVAKSLERALFISNLTELLEQEPRIRSGTSETPIRGDIELRNVHFTYRGSSEPVLHGVNMKIEAGSTVALLGPNGCGKTTLTRLIARLYDVTEGEICIDGKDIRELSLPHLRASMAYVSQNPVPFEATARENVAYGDWERLAEATAEVRRAASEVGISEMIEGLPQGYDTQLGRLFGTFDLSGGQWQKLALARALAKDAPILILDEPTASMDIRSEAEMLRHFQRLARGKTTLLISHRFSTVAMADHIYVMDEGRIVEHGTHGELREQRGTYAALYELHERMATRAESEAES
jgi:ATP-binding cassette subfamily B protein